MIDSNFLLGKLPVYQGKKILITSDQSTNDIINEMIQAHKLHRADYDKISTFFWQGNLKDTCKFIFDFLKRNVKYSIEPDERQSIKSPSAILSTGYYKNGYNDCKHYSQFISGILDSLKRKGHKLDWFYRFANYRFFTKQPQHVFVVATQGSKVYWIDPVLNYFNERKPFINKIDKKMSLYSISGTKPQLYETLNDFSGYGIGRRKKAPGKKKKGIFKKVKNAVLKVSMAPSRAAFLALVRLNPFRIAPTLYKSLADKIKGPKLLEKWRNLGGNPNVLAKLIVSSNARWKKRKKISGFDANDVDIIGFIDILAKRAIHRKLKRKTVKNCRCYPANLQFNKRMSGIGSVNMIGAIQVAAVLAVAIPIITALLEFLPKGMKNKAQTAAENVPDIAAAQQEIAKSGENIQVQVPTGTRQEVMNVSEQKNEDTGEQETVLTDKKGSNNMLLYAGIGAGVLYVISKK